MLAVPLPVTHRAHEKKSVTWMQVVSENPNDDLRAIDTKLQQLWEATGMETRSEMEALAAQAFFFTFFFLPYFFGRKTKPQDRLGRTDWAEQNRFGRTKPSLLQL